jgi:hypothetical protein
MEPQDQQGDLLEDSTFRLVYITGGAFDNFQSSIVSKVSDSIVKLIDKDTSEQERYLECAELNELSEAFICISYFHKPMNRMFTRIRFHSGTGKGIAKGQMLQTNDFKLIKMVSSI